MGQAGLIPESVSPRPMPPRKLAMEEGTDGVRIIFAMPPAWVCLTPTVIGLIVGLAYILVVILTITLLWRMKNDLHLPIRDLLSSQWMVLGAMVLMGAYAAIWPALGVHAWRMYRRWGRVPRVISVNSKSLVVSELGFRRMKEKRWIASDITAVRLRPVWGNLTKQITVNDLYIGHRTRRRMRFRLSSRDAQLPARIAERLAAVLGCPLL
jgi:hypothetical protein